MSKFLINIDNGIIAFRDEYTDKQVNMKPIPDNVVDMIVSGEVKTEDVIKAVNAKIRESGEYDDIEKYLQERAKLNVRRSNPQKPIEHEKLADRSNEEISLSDVLDAKKDDTSKADRKAKAKKSEQVFDALAGM